MSDALRDDHSDPACELGVPSKPSQAKRRPGVLAPAKIHGAALLLIIETHGECGAIIEAFKLGQSLGHGRMGSMLGCKSCGKRSVAIVAQEKICLLCGDRP